MLICWSHIKVEISVLFLQFRCTDCALKHPTRKPLIVFVLLEIECSLIKLNRSILIYEQVEIRGPVSMTFIARFFSDLFYVSVDWNGVGRCQDV